jgi:thymidylate kinase
MPKFRFEIADAEFAARKARERKARERVNQQDQQFWKDLAKKYLKIAEIEDPRKREMTIEAYFTDMHDEAPKFLTRYLHKKQLPEVGDFEEVPRGIVSPEILWD